MNICVLFDTIESPTGGGNQFLKALIAELSRMGHHVTSRPGVETDVVLVNGFNYASGRRLRVREVALMRQRGRMNVIGRIVPLWYSRSLVRRGPAIVHRVDGVPQLTRGRRTVADDVQPAVNELADHTIFQSEFCRTSFTEQGCGSPEKWCVINNGVDPTIFFPADEPRPNSVFRFVAASWSRNERKGFATLAQLSRLPGIQVVFAGNWCREVEPQDVMLAGTLRSSEVAQLMRTGHALVHAAWNEPCSNTIVEAMACGLPVLYRDSGGSAELVRDCGIPLRGDLKQSVAEFVDAYGLLSQRVRSQRPRFLVNGAAREYVAAFQSAIAHRRRANAP